ncbi:hypothetical protein GF312_09760 [Candidatus Poribacteria bacterium]|nr:hypothetical protein [Candidatus Poribacteria bacterium]
MVNQASISIIDFGKAMLKMDYRFKVRVKDFEKKFGKVNDNTLAIMAQAAYFCWGNAEYKNNILHICKAVRTGKPTYLIYHNQLTPERWSLINSYLLGVQKWLGFDFQNNIKADKVVIEKINQWLGEHSPEKEALAEVFSANLAARLMGVVLSGMGDNGKKTPIDYEDYTSYYITRGGVEYKPYIPGKINSFVEEAKQKVLEMGDENLREIMEGILKASSPPCIHRFTRYMDIQISSIGALKWRGNLPEDNLPVSKWENFIKECHNAINTWADGALPRGELAFNIHRILGKPNERNKAILFNFLLAENRGGDCSWKWLVEKNREIKATAFEMFSSDQ